jgi:hypothetical protein
MSHRIKRFAAFAIFALFYHFAAVDSILGLGGHHVDTKVDTKTATATTRSSLSDETGFGVQFALSQSKNSMKADRRQTQLLKLYAPLKGDTAW